MRDGKYVPSRFLVILVVVSQATAVPVTSLCLKEVLKAETKLAKDPKEIVIPEIQLVWNIVAQVRAEPLVIYERAKAIFFSSVS